MLDKPSGTNDTLTAVDGVQVGHYTDAEAATGCTVVLLPRGTRGAVSLRGRAHGNRELTPLRPGGFVDEVHAVLLTGGSAFGLAAADGVMKYLEERGHGYETTFARVPIVPAAALYDLNLGRADVRPGAEAGYAACRAAAAVEVEMGSVGAGTGATIGKIAGMGRAMKSGVGSAVKRLAGGATIGALVAVNALGDVLDFRTARIIAGARGPEGTFLDTNRMIQEAAELPPMGGKSTTIAVIATDASFDRVALRHIADTAHDGMARAISPVHTMFDGDTVFAVSAGTRSCEINAAASAAADVLAEAIARAVTSASTLHGVPSWRDLRK